MSTYQKKHSEVLVVARSSGAVDDDSAKDTLPGLQPNVRVIPRGTILRSLPLVRVFLSGGGRALSNRDYTVVLIG